MSFAHFYRSFHTPILLVAEKHYHIETAVRLLQHEHMSCAVVPVVFRLIIINCEIFPVKIVKTLYVFANGSAPFPKETCALAIFLSLSIYRVDVSSVGILPLQAIFS